MWQNVTQFERKKKICQVNVAFNYIIYLFQNLLYCFVFEQTPLRFELAQRGQICLFIHVRGDWINKTYWGSFHEVHRCLTYDKTGQVQLRLSASYCTAHQSLQLTLQVVLFPLTFPTYRNKVWTTESE